MPPLTRIPLDGGGCVLVERTAPSDGPVKAGRIGDAVQELPLEGDGVMEGRPLGSSAPGRDQGAPSPGREHGPIPTAGADARVWDATTGEMRSVLTKHTGEVSALAFSPDGDILATGGGWDGTVQLWDPATGKARTTFVGANYPYGVYSLAFSPDGRTLATASEDGTVRLWDVAKTTLDPTEAIQRICRTVNRDLTP